MKVLILGKYSYQTYPIVPNMIEVSNKIIEQIGKIYKFENNSVVLMTDDDKKEFEVE